MPVLTSQSAPGRKPRAVDPRGFRPRSRNAPNPPLLSAGRGWLTTGRRCRRGRRRVFRDGFTAMARHTLHPGDVSCRLAEPRGQRLVHVVHHRDHDAGGLFGLLFVSRKVIASAPSFLDMAVVALHPKPGCITAHCGDELLAGDVLGEDLKILGWGRRLATSTAGALGATLCRGLSEQSGHRCREDKRSDSNTYPDQSHNAP